MTHNFQLTFDSDQETGQVELTLASGDGYQVGDSFVLTVPQQNVLDAMVANIAEHDANAERDALRAENEALRSQVGDLSMRLAMATVEVGSFPAKGLSD